MRNNTRAAQYRRFGVASLFAVALAFAAALFPSVPSAEPVPVRFTDGTVRGFLVLRALDGTALADGDITQTVRGDQVTARLEFRFKDGSTSEQTTVYSQRWQFRLISDHLVQKGPSFPQAVDMTINAGSGQVTVRYNDERGKQQTASERFDMPPDLANGMIGKLLMNAHPNAVPRSLSFIAATPRPRLVKLLISDAGPEQFTIGGAAHNATRYAVKVDIGGLAGVLAPLVGKQPPDSHVWIARGDVPTFVRAEQPLYAGGPMWRIELAGPEWPRPTRMAQNKAP